MTLLLWLYWLDMDMDMSVICLLFFLRLVNNFTNIFEPNYCADIVSSLSFEALFYIGLATFPACKPREFEGHICNLSPRTYVGSHHRPQTLEG